MRSYISYLANERVVSSSAQNQALSAIMFPDKNVLLTGLDAYLADNRSKRSIRLPTVLSHQEALTVIEKTPFPPRECPLPAALSSTLSPFHLR